MNKITPVTLVLLIALSGAAYAEEETSGLNQVVVTADKYIETIANTAGNVTVITEEVIKRKGARTLGEAISGVSGVTAGSLGGRGELSRGYILGSERIVVLIDGKRMNTAQGNSQGDGGVDFNTYLLGDNIERIEIVKGGGSVLYGADAIAGVINVITKKGTGKTRGAVSAAAGSNNAADFKLTLSGGEKKTSFFLTGEKGLADGRRPRSAYNGKNFSLRLDQELAATETLTLNYAFYSNYAEIPGNVNLLPLPQNDFSNLIRRNFSVEYSNDHESGSRVFRFYRNEQRYSGENYGYFEHQNTMNAFEYSDSLKLNEKNFLSFGGEWRQDKVQSTNYAAPKSGVTKALYIQDKYEFNDKVSAIAGLRYDDHSIYGSRFLPRVALIYKEDSMTSYFINWGKVFKAPNFDQLFWNDPWTPGNENLRPEHGWTADIGIKKKLNKAAELSLTIFKRDLSDMIRWAALAPTYNWSPYNIDSVSTTGINIDFSARLSKRDKVNFGYTYLDSKDGAGNWIGDPHNSFNLNVDLLRGAFTQNISFIYQDKSGLGSAQVTSVFTINTNSNYQLTKETSLFLTIKNLLDRKYQIYAGYPAEGRIIMFGAKYNF